jgi:hypothetical protein
VALAALGLVPRTARAATTLAAADPLASRLRAIVPHLDSAVVIGREYLRVAPGERESGRLWALISDGWSAAAIDAEGDALRRRLDERTRQDFAEGRIVTVHGWMLSATEARLCGLVALGLE